MMSGSGIPVTKKRSERLLNARALHRLLSYAADEAREGQHDTCRRHILDALDALSLDLDSLMWDGVKAAALKNGGPTRQ